MGVQAFIAGAVMAAGLLPLGLPALAGVDILEVWDQAEPPPKPEISPVTLNPETTAVLFVDMMQKCYTRTRCTATVPYTRDLHDKARAVGALFYYTLVGGENPTPADWVSADFAPQEGEWIARGGPDKFYRTPLEERLKAHSIETVIICGGSVQGAVLGTANGAAQRGYQVVIPIDCVASEEVYMEQYAFWHLYKTAPAMVTQLTTLSRSDLIRFSDNTEKATENE